MIVVLSVFGVSECMLRLLVVGELMELIVRIHLKASNLAHT